MTGWIILLIILGILLFVAELFLLPGITIAAIGSFCCLVGAVAVAFNAENPSTGWIVLVIVLALLVVLTTLFLRSATWKKIALNTQIPEALETHKSRIGDTGRAITRLAPMGKVMINDEIIEAKTMGGYIDEDREIEVIGMDNMNIIVKLKE